MMRSISLVRLVRFGLPIFAVVLIGWVATYQRSQVLANDDQAVAGEVIRGQVLFEESTPAFKDATLHVYIEEFLNNQKDRPAKIFAQLVLKRISREKPHEEGIPFALGDFQPVGKNGYNLRVHVAMGSEPRELRGEYVAIKSGDFLSMQPHPVMRGEKDQKLQVNLRKIP